MSQSHFCTPVHTLRLAQEVVDDQAPLEVGHHFFHGDPRVAEALREARDAWEGDGQKSPRDLMPRVIYEAIYCPRGDMENRIKECQFDLFGHRASAHAFKANQTRLILAGFAYVLMTQLRLRALTGTELAKAAPGTIRQKLLKIGARIITSVRRIRIAMPDACPTQGLFFTAWRFLAPP